MVIIKPIDILFLTHNRLDFTKASFAALLANTNWELVRSFCWYDDMSEDGTRDFMYRASAKVPVETHSFLNHYGSPVVVMGRYLQRGDFTEYFAKIDSDTMVPRGWLSECFKVMKKHPELGLLGIEAFDPVELPYTARGYRPCEHIGGIGLMRPELMEKDPPEPHGRRFGFTEWQHAHREVVKGWLTPALPVYLLDRVPFEPWKSLSEKYIAKGWQRPWPLYTPAKDANIWPWVERGPYIHEPEVA